MCISIERTPCKSIIIRTQTSSELRTATTFECIAEFSSFIQQTTSADFWWREWKWHEKYSRGIFTNLISRKPDIAWNCNFKYAAYSTRQITLLSVCKKLCVILGRIKLIVISPTYTDERLMDLSFKYFTTNEEAEISGSHGGNKITVFWCFFDRVS
jgi:hypothetical protein